MKFWWRPLRKCFRFSSMPGGYDRTGAQERLKGHDGAEIQPLTEITWSSEGHDIVFETNDS
jgi:hypothetical protein